MEFRLKYTSREVEHTHAPTQKAEVKKYYNYDLVKKAYAKWANASPHCQCLRHGNVLFGVSGLCAYSPSCNRDRAWWAYVKAREGYKLSDEELFLVGVI